MSKKNRHDNSEQPGLDAEGCAPDTDTAQAAEADRIAELEAQVADAEARALRAMADFQNFQRRSAANELEARKQGVTSVVSGLLPVLDNFALALGQKEAGGTAEQILGGVEIVRAELLRALEMQGVTVINAEPGDELDPGKHEAVSQMPIEGIEPGRVGQVFQTGYMLGDRVLRPAKVVVAAVPPEHGAEEGEDPPGGDA